MGASVSRTAGWVAASAAGRRRGLVLLALVAALALAGCKIELYSNVSEREGNEMLALLLSAGIDADKVVDRDGKTTLRVEENQVERAVSVLLARGLPRSKSLNIMDIFKSEGLIASAGAERMRYIYAMSEELSGTLSQLDGAVAVRVHIAVPEEKRAGQGQRSPPSAAVFIKYQSQYDFGSYVPLIKQLVANSVEGVTYDKVSVVLFPTESNLMVPDRTAAPAAERGTVDLGSLGQAQPEMLLAGAAGLLAALGLGGYVMVLRRRLRSQGRARMAERDAVARGAVQNAAAR